MKIFKCHKCEKYITEDDIGLRNAKGYVYCKTCMLKLTEKDIRENQLKNAKEIEEINIKKSRSITLKTFLFIAIPIILIEIIFFLIPINTSGEIVTNSEEFNKMDGPLGDLIKLGFAANSYYSKNKYYPNSLNEIDSLYHVENDSIVYIKNTEYGYFIYKQGEIPLDPVITAKGIFPTFILKGGE